MTFTVVLVPFDNSKPLESHDVSFDEDDEDFIEKFNVLIDAADEHRHKAMDVLMMPLVRPQEGSYLQPEIPGLFAYYHKDFSEHDERQGQALSKANIRATRLAMACGLLSIRFYGNVLLVRSRSALGGDKRWENLKVSDLIGPCCISPDLRHDIQEQIVELLPANDDLESRTMVPDWIAGAAQQNYHDAAAMAQLASVMNLSGDQQQNNDCDEEADSGTDSDGSDQDDETGGHSGKEQVSHISLSVSDENQQSRTFVTKRPLCLHCRGLSSRLCQDCDGAYFCEPPRTCRDIGWSHSCLCPTWKLYTNRRHELSTFEFLGDWQLPLVGRSFQTSEDPFEEFLTTYIGIVDTSSCTSWWRTELGGWSGGQSDSASSVDATIRRSYSEGFAPLDTSMIPPHRRVTTSDFFVAGLPDRKNSVGFSVLSGGWHDYYKLRGILNSSPVALLCTFPMTIYHAIVQYGEVPATVATMLKRPLRIHVVGAEKELNCLDLFAEIGFLLPEDFKVELVFVVREDMLPPKCTKDTKGSRFSLKIELTTNLTVGVVSGTYGQVVNGTSPSSSSSSSKALDPNFDCGSGPPDMIIALNAGLYAYESWRSVVSYLYNNAGIIGVFTDYNEYSGVNCAALGGSKSRQSLCVNPFRQPRAMPVYSMNLPQFSNGFFYVFNEQHLE